MFTNSANRQNAASPVSIPITMNTANVEALKDEDEPKDAKKLKTMKTLKEDDTLATLKEDDLLSSREDFVKAEKLPLIYLTGWFRDALNYALANFDDDYCDKLMLKFEGMDWSIGFKGPSMKGVLGPDICHPASDAYFDFIEDMLFVVPSLHLRGKSEKLEKLIGMANEAYDLNPVLFTSAFQHYLKPFMDHGTFAKHGYIDYGWCSVTKFYYCYAIRVLRSQQPFVSVHLHELDGVIEKYEVALMVDDLTTQCEEIVSFGSCPYPLMCKVMEMHEEEEGL